MELIKVRVPDNHNLVVGGDFHIGSLLHSEEGLGQMIEYVGSTKNAYFAGTGDYQEAITVDDPRFDFRTQGVPYDPLTQTYEVLDRLKPISDKILALGTGNHEWKLQRFGDLVKNLLCRELNTKYGTYTYKLTVNNMKGKLLYKVFISHGFGSINSSADSRRRKDANMKLSLERKLKEKASDCKVMCMGHTHKLIVGNPIDILHLTDDGTTIQANYHNKDAIRGFIHPEHRWYVNTGSFLKLYEVGMSGYAEMAGYDPVDLGYPVIKCVDGQVTEVEQRRFT